MSSSSSTTWEPGSSGTATEPLAPDARIVDDRFVADDRAVGKRGDRGLEVQCLCQRHGHHLDAERLKMGRKLRDAFGVRATAEADPHRAVMLQHVAAVEGARRFDRRDAISLSAHRVFGRADLAPPFVGARTADDGEVAVDDHGVFDESRVGALRCGNDLVCGPARVPESRDVSLPLTLGEFDIHVIASIDVGDEPFGEPR